MSGSQISEPQPKFLSVEEVIELHEEGIRLYGGESGIRDFGLVESATLAPQQTWGGEFLCQDLAEMAATYWYNLTQNHGFIDGNKRVGLAACDVFLLINGLDIGLTDDGEAVDLAVNVAAGQITKEALTIVLRDRIKELSS